MVRFGICFTFDLFDLCWLYGLFCVFGFIWFLDLCIYWIKRWYWRLVWSWPVFWLFWVIMFCFVILFVHLICCLFDGRLNLWLYLDWLCFRCVCGGLVLILNCFNVVIDFKISVIWVSGRFALIVWIAGLQCLCTCMRILRVLAIC